MSEFKRELRYFVLKVKDVDKFLNDKDKVELNRILDKISFGRSINGKEDLECVVVENDWPEYEQVWDMIKKRVESQV